MRSRLERTANARGACGARPAILLSGLAPFFYLARSSLRAYGAVQQRQQASPERAKKAHPGKGSRLARATTRAGRDDDPVGK